MERWEIIDEFPYYKVSDYGRVANIETGRIIKQSRTAGGIVKVGLVNSGRQYTRSVCNLVAEKFVDGSTEMFDTPIHLDFDKTNNYYKNLLWRPRWFAWKYTRQANEGSEHFERGPLIDVDTNIVYNNFYHAATTFGILAEDIWRCVIFKKRIFPTNQLFRLT